MTIHLLYGGVGAGKTTFARWLALEKKAVCFCPDEWMSALYGQDPPAERFPEYLDRVVGLIWGTVARLVELEVDVVLDFGFWTRRSRDEARERVRELGAEAVLYELACSQAERRRRVLARTADMAPGVLYVNEAAMEVLDGRLEPLGPDEHCIVVNSEDLAVES